MKYLEYLVITVALFIALCCTILIGDKTFDALFGGYSYAIVQVDADLPMFKLSDVDSNGPTKGSALIRLHEDSPNEPDRFFCSGFVISDNYAMTAAHCLVDHKQHKKTNDIIIHTMDNSKVTIKVKAVAINIISDLGLVKGDFKQFNKLHIDPRPQSFLATKLPLFACGFPYGDTDLCVPFVPGGNYYSMVVGRGILFPGMSGGPVIDLSRQTVIGVNSGTIPGGIIIAPIVGIFADAKISWGL